jgi:hypothetical protein
MRSATTVEMLYTLHTLWKEGQLETAKVRHILLTSCFLYLTSITNGGITAESQDGKQKYSIK